MTIKIFHLVKDHTTIFVKKAFVSTLCFDDAWAFSKFVKPYQAVIEEATKLYGQFKEKIEAKDENTIKSWAAYLETEIEIPKLPVSILKNVPEITPEQILHLEPLFEPLE